MPQACHTFIDLTLGYIRHLAVHHFNGVVRKGSIVAVVGGNGSGTPTLIKVLAIVTAAIQSGHHPVRRRHIFRLRHSKHSWPASVAATAICSPDRLISNCFWKYP